MEKKKVGNEKKKGIHVHIVHSLQKTSNCVRQVKDYAIH